MLHVFVQAARNSVTRESAALQEQRAAIQSLLAQLEQREEALGQVREGLSELTCSLLL